MTRNTNVGRIILVSRIVDSTNHNIFNCNAHKTARRMKLELAVSTNLSRLRDISSSPWERESDKPERASASMANGAGIRIRDPEISLLKGFPNEYRKMSSRGYSGRRFATALGCFLVSVLAPGGPVT